MDALHDRTLPAQALRFALVGVANTAISAVAYAVAVELVPAPVAAALAFAAGAVNGYVLNRSWTFAARDDAGTRARYLTVQLLGLGLSSGLVWATVSEGGLGRYAGFALTLPLVTAATFVLARGWVFRCVPVPRA